MPSLIKSFIFFALSLLGVAAHAEGVLIHNDNFGKAFKDAKPGDVFTIYPGIYHLTNIQHAEANGTKENPIILRPHEGGKVVIEVESKIGIKISGAHWIIEDLEFRGICEKHGKCEHALQIVSHADGTIVRNNRFIDFNAAIKGNGEVIDNRQYFPDDVLIEKNVIYNEVPRHTANPVTPIDVVGGRRWIIRENFIADFQKALGNKVSMAAFLKGNSDHGLFERNLIVCEWRHRGGIRLGLSFGGGGTSNPKYCQGRSCKIEHYKGTIRSNIIMNCPKDVGIYLNNAASTTITNNTIINTAGIDARFNGTFATIANNIVHGRIKDRDGGRHREMNNIVEANLADIFPRAAYYDLTPEDLDDLMKAARGFEGVDFCSGQPQEQWIGAMAYPPKCEIQDRLSAAPESR